MNRQLVLISSAFCLASAAIVTTALAQPATPPPAPGAQGRRGPADRPMPEPQMRPGGMRQRDDGMPPPATLKEQLRLTDAQQAEIRKVREGARRDRIRASADLKIASLDLRSLMRGDKVDEKAVAAKISEIQTARGALLKLRVDAAMAMKKVLTPEQQKKHSELRGQGRMGRGRMRGPDGMQGAPGAFRPGRNRRGDGPNGPAQGRNSPLGDGSDPSASF